MTMSKMNEAERIEELEAKLAKAVEALEGIIRLDEDYSPFGGEFLQDRVERTWTNARTTLAELKGESQDGMV